jgi:predicted PurR-regulated permease PerM
VGADNAIIRRMLRDPWLRALAVVALAIAGFYLVGLIWQVFEQFADIFLLFFLAWLLAFVLEPVVGMAERARLPRLPAIAATYVVLLVFLSAAVILLVPALTAEVAEIVRKLPSYSEQVAGWVARLQDGANVWLLEHNSPVMLDTRSALNPNDLTRRVDAVGPTILGNALGLATGVLTLLFGLLLVVILSFYFMLDGARLAELFIRTLPRRAQDDTRFLVANIHRAFAGFLRGQVIIALAGGLGTGLIMSLLHVDYALLCSVVASVMLLIPFLGPVIAVWLPITIALLTNSEAIWALLVALLALQQVLFQLISPRIFSTQVGMHPLAVFFAVLAGARVAGIWGAVFGVPVVAVVLSMYSFYRASQEERAARLHEELPGLELVSVGPEAASGPIPLSNQRKELGRS